MAKFMIFGLLTTGLCVFVPTSAEKQIKLEDIEKDNLKAAQQAKLEKQYQQYQFQTYQQTPVQYTQQVYAQQQAATYPSAYYQYSLPQQYVQPQQVYSGYAPIASNSLSAGYSAASSVHPYQAYYTPQISSAVQGSQHYSASAHPQSIIMAVASPSYSGLQQQAYYQVLPKTIGNVQYVQSQTAQAPQYYYQPQTQAVAPSSAAASSGSLLYASPQQYVPSYQYLTGSKVSPAYQQYISTAPQTFSTSYSTSEAADYSSAYPAQSAAAYQTQSAVAYPAHSAAAAYSTGSVYTQTEQPTFVSLKAPQHLVASPGQQQQYLQAQAEAAQTASTTISPFKYLNSPQYLAQNYNTIQSSHFIPKNSFSSGIKSTVSPPIKFTGNTGFITPSSSSSTSSSNYHTYRGIAG